MMAEIDLNCDLGESFGVYRMGNDEAILDYVTSCNIACGFHAGDPATMRKTVKLALDKGVAIGAHPGFADLAGFGRRKIDISPQEVYDIVTYQIGALSAFVKAEGGRLVHVKPHGALYNMAAVNGIMAQAIAQAIYKFDPTFILYGLAGSQLIEAGTNIGLKTANEVFADRTYQSDGTLTPRSHHHCFVDNEEQAFNQVIKMVLEKRVTTVSAEDIAIEADTVCIHGDGPNALDFAKKLSVKLPEAGIKIAAIEKTY
jgi:5-oxoprolinase (ATP-hydrolysing) subunit A